MVERISYTEDDLKRVSSETGLSFSRAIGTRRGSVLIASYKERFVVAKIADKTSTQTEEGLNLPRSVGIKNESRILGILDGAVGPKVLFYKEHPELIYLVTEYIGDIHVPRPTLSDLHEPKKGVAALAKAVEKLHTKGIVHGDIQPENVLVFYNPESEVDATLVDFEQAKLLQESSGSHSGLYHYLTPENALKTLNDARIDIQPADDVFSLAATCLAMLTRSYPVSYTAPNLTRKQRLSEIASFRKYSTLGAKAEHAGLASMIKDFLRLPSNQRPESINSFITFLQTNLQEVA